VYCAVRWLTHQLQEEVLTPSPEYVLVFDGPDIQVEFP
jgi:hypothetical protein